MDVGQLLVTPCGASADRTGTHRESDDGSRDYPTVIEPGRVDARPFRIRAGEGDRNSIDNRKPKPRLLRRIHDTVLLAARSPKFEHRKHLPGVATKQATVVPGVLTVDKYTTDGVSHVPRKPSHRERSFHERLLPAAGRAVAGLVVVCGRFHFEPIEGDTLRADTNLGEEGKQLRLKRFLSSRRRINRGCGHRSYGGSGVVAGPLLVAGRTRSTRADEGGSTDSMLSRLRMDAFW